MSKNIGTAKSVVTHDKCGKVIAKEIDGVLHVQCLRQDCENEWVPILGWVKEDPLAKYRGIEGLIVVGPAELDKACRSLDQNNLNPLDLEDGWIPNIGIDPTIDKWICSGKWRTNKDWTTRAFLVLCPPEIGGIPTSLIGQNKLWGVPHDGIEAGNVRQDVFYSNWFLKENYDWANVPVVDQWRWLLGFEHPRWTTNLDWDGQQKAAKKKDMQISTAAQDVFALNVVLAATGIRLRSTTWSRTSTIFDGSPLHVYSFGARVYVFRSCPPGHAFDSVAASVQGVPGSW